MNQPSEFIIKSFEGFMQESMKKGTFSLDDFIAAMEKKFSEAGYRDLPKANEKLNVLIIHDAGIGDFVLQSGAIREIRRLYSGAHITLMVNGGSLPLAESCPYVDEVIVLDEVKAGFVEMYTACAQMARKVLISRQDICYAFIHRAWTPFLMYMSGARIRITYRAEEIEEVFLMSKPNDLLRSVNRFTTEFVSMFEYGATHMVDGLFAPLDHVLKAPVANRELEIWCTAVDMTSAEVFLSKLTRPIYVMSMGGVEFMKHYPPEKYAELVKKILREEPTATFVLVGGGDADVNSAAAFKAALGEEIFNARVADTTNRLNIRQVASIIILSDMYIGNDTGAMHIAAAAKRPILSPNCFADDLPRKRSDYVNFFSPYHVPSVIVQPKHALDECKVTEPYDSMGCRVNKPHCITQITVDALLHGFHLLKVCAADKINEPLFLS